GVENGSKKRRRTRVNGNKCVCMNLAGRIPIAEWHQGSAQQVDVKTIHWRIEPRGSILAKLLGVRRSGIVRKNEKGHFTQAWHQGAQIIAAEWSGDGHVGAAADDMRPCQEAAVANDNAIRIAPSRRHWLGF